MKRWSMAMTLAGWLAFGFLASMARAEDSGVIKGKVVFKGDAEKYKRETLDTSKDPNCKKSKDKIGSYAVVLNKKADPITIQNVLVSIKEGLGDKKFPPKTDTVKLSQHGCEYTPHVIALMEGQTLKVVNEDDTNHNIHFQPKKNEELNFSQPKKDPDVGKDIKLVVESVFKIKCDVHPWMGGHVAVFSHPFFSVTGDSGTFEIKGLPPGKYVVEAWHETFGTQTMNVEVSPGAPVEKDFTFEPK